MNHWTISEISKELGVERHRVLWLVVSRGIQPAGKIGQTRIYSDAAYRTIADAIANREGAANAE